LGFKFFSRNFLHPISPPGNLASFSTAEKTLGSGTESVCEYTLEKNKERKTAKVVARILMIEVCNKIFIFLFTGTCFESEGRRKPYYSFNKK